MELTSQVLLCPGKCPPPEGVSLSLRPKCCCGVNEEGQAALYRSASTNSEGNSHVVPYVANQENVWFSRYPNSSKSNHVYRNTEQIKTSLCCFNIKAELKAAVKLPQLSAELAKAPDAAAAKFLNGYSRTEGMTSPDDILRMEMFVLISQCVIFSLCCCSSYTKYNHY